MRKTLAFCAATLMVLGLSLVSGSASAAGPEDMTIKGEVVDNPCYESKGGARGEAHKSCALSCAKRGNQLAIVQDGTNTVYLITGDYAANKNEKLVEFVAAMVEAKGAVSEKDGKKWLAISSIKKVETK
jgi:type 1 fimbria pilin